MEMLWVPDVVIQWNSQLCVLTLQGLIQSRIIFENCSDFMLQNIIDRADQKVVRIAYIIAAHHRPDLIIRTVRRLYKSTHGFFIHFDAKSPDIHFQRLVDGLKDLENVKFLKRFKCRWGNVGSIRGVLGGIGELAKSDFIYDYAIQMSGLDYPIKSNFQIEERLALARGGSFMEASAWPIPNWENGRAIKRIENYFIHLPVPYWLRKIGWQPAWQHLSIPMKRKIPGGLHPHFGSAFWYLHRNCLQYIHEYVMRHPEFVAFFAHTYIPDECFFQTLVMNSPFAATVTTRSLTHCDWRPPWPGIMTLDDLPKLRKSDCLLARKFDPVIDGQVLDELDSINEPAFSFAR
jgi:hypothetical protein